MWKWNAVPQLNCIDLKRTTQAALPRIDPDAEHSPPFSLGETNCFHWSSIPAGELKAAPSAVRGGGTD
jgi:hypothetical protein